MAVAGSWAGGAYGWDAIVRTEVIDDWSVHREQTAAYFGQHDGVAVDDHPHRHGANPGRSGAAYRRAGGFPRLALAERPCAGCSPPRITRAGHLPVATAARHAPGKSVASASYWARWS